MLFLVFAAIVMLATTLSSCSGDVGNKNRECIKCNEFEVGETFELDGVIYTVADGKMLDKALENGEDLTKYCTSKVTNMRFMFRGATSFNQEIGNWDVSNVTDMNGMFLGAASFNQDIGNWDVSNVQNMKGMFSYATSFNQDIGNWDVSNVSNMGGMFLQALSFNQDLSQWCVSKIPSIPDDFSKESGLTPANHPVWGTCPP